ncbi:N-acetylmuramoyl-L-alanine amidase-like domain-containing protein [Tellurirhabdus bombi]|uniref:N-acetylmuramoyl-L-alanine amidase-like domain-containing protein n=1 Tax=Tellurirhabdus bombi TaxID=2907205 RepID=UPI001F490F6A|nr:N-acetylmuramoyl-L-alanine amidase-like domain-containing protein [Tellurirhabdus bombi]
MNKVFAALVTLAVAASPSLAQYATSDIRQVAFTTGRTAAETTLSIGKSFLGKPYVAHTLDQGNAEQLLVDFQQFDCTTYVETVLALALTAQKPAEQVTSESQAFLFRDQLTQLRYRDGVVNGYASRLHYFSDWLKNNEKKGLIQDVTQKIGGIKVSKPITYMTSSTWKYPQLSDPEVYKQIDQVQQDISKQPFWFIPKAKIKAIEANLQDGDIIMLTAARPGLDMKHVGFAIWQTDAKGERHVYLLHASSEYGEVMITEQPLTSYVLWNKRLSGIRVARLSQTNQPQVLRAMR